MEEVMPDLIDEDQSGFIKCRQTQDNIRRCLHIIEHIEKEKLRAILLSVDAEKAFDSVGWQFLYKVMGKFGFHEKFITSIKTLYTAPMARIKVNGGLSNSIHLQRGCRQGCPASPLLFNLFIEPLAQAIRQDLDLEGIIIRDTEHKICLFADDVLVSLKNPELGVPRLMDLLQEYGALSGYTLNIDKTQALVFNFVSSPVLKNKYRFNWDSTSIKYLGVTLTKDISLLYSKNYIQINTSIKEDLDRWAPLPLDIGSRIMVIKTNILPRLLYLFQSLPIHIPDNQFREWDKLISRFIWSSKAPRVRYKTLQLPKASGGMGLPNLKDYYLAAQVKPLLLWCNQEYISKWKAMELSLLDRPLQSLLGLPQTTKLYDIQSQWVRLAIDIWCSIVKQLNIQKEMRILAWPVYDPEFNPAVEGGGFVQWERQGLTALCLLVEKGELMDFKAMSKRYSLSQQDFYRYLQLRHYFNKNVKELLPEKMTGITQMFIKAYNGKLSKKIIGELYRYIVELRGHSTFYVKAKWEEELGIVITPEQWTNIINTQITTTGSHTWRDFSWKNCMRFFITPQQKSKQTGTQPKCWRGCGNEKANHSHIFWECPMLQTFWESVHAIIKSVLCFDIEFTSLSFYLGDMDLNLTRDDRYLLKIFMVAGKKAVTRRWLSAEPPNTSQWIAIVTNIQCMECLTYSLRLQKDKYDAMWRKWDLYLTTRDDNLLCS
uniref:Reverse transcriptase domain-containing protein n=1 Tax=Salarias fasciatus TaxID=181472 RepID=A0A672H408_SALFA